MAYTLETLVTEDSQNKDIHLVWKYFFELSTIPRPSKHEEKVREWVLTYAKQWNRKIVIDDFQNIVLEIPASNSQLETLPKIAIQSHLDMVCEKDSNITHNFFNDPLQLEIINAPFKGVSEGPSTQWISAVGTTLGADNGIAVAMAMALADPQCSREHGPLQLLFTLDEETGLNGAANLGPKMIDAPFLINIDNAQEKVLCIGCAGGRDFIANVPLCRQELQDKNLQAYVVSVDKLAGGHSGMEIYDGRGNALKVLERAISLIKNNVNVFALNNICGGDKRNAIPRFAQAKIYFAQEHEQKIITILEKLQSTQRRALPSVDVDLSIGIQKNNEQVKENVLTSKSLENILDIMRMCPHGVIFRKGMGEDDPSLSNNMASVAMSEHEVIIVNNSRFSFELEEKHMFDIFETIYKNSAAKMNTENSYCSWEPEESSKLQNVFIRVHEQLLGEKPIVRVVHAGLECGLIKQQTEREIDVIAVGPEIQFLHSPKERLHIESTQRMWALLCNLFIKI